MLSPALLPFSFLLLPSSAYVLRSQDHDGGDQQPEEHNHEHDGIKQAVPPGV
jgi:hypothetical protein